MTSKSLISAKLPKFLLLVLLHTAAHSQRPLAPIAPLDAGKATPRLLTSVIYECERRALRRRLSVDDAVRCEYTKWFSEDRMFGGDPGRMHTWLAEQRFFIEAELTP
jgi:hypothetical protein